MGNWLSRLFGGRSRQEEDEFGPAGPDSIAYLESAGYPGSVIQHFRSSEPRDWVEVNGVRMYPVSHIREENEQAIPGYVVRPMGYLNIGSTDVGDTYCVDLNTRNDKGEPAVVLVSHEEVRDDSSPDDVSAAMIKIADSFGEFLSRFKSGDLPSQYFEAKETSE